MVCKDPKKEVERRKRLSESHKGKIQSPETIEKRVAHLRGIPRPLGVRALLSDAAKEQWAKPEVRELMTARIKETRPDMSGEKNPFHGKTHTKESKDVMSASHKKFYEDNPEARENARLKSTGKKQSPETIERRVSKIRGRLRLDLKGKKLSESHKQNISKGLEGREYLPMTKESLLKVGAAQKRLWQDPEYHKKMCELHIGLQARENHPNWKGGITPVRVLIQSSDKYTEWRNAVYERDNFCDWFSGVEGNGNLNAHHIIPFNVLLKRYKIKTFEDALNCTQLWDVNNGITLIDTTHIAYHQMWGSDGDVRN